VTGVRAGSVSLSTLVIYSLPAAAVGFTFMLTGVYLVKYAAEVLLIGPGIMGTLWGLSRIWDAVSDPIAGHLSDRTDSRMGRRRSWIAFSALPVCLGFAMMWQPPAALAGSALHVWMGVAVFFYFTATTMFSVPHEALAAELSVEYHERTRIFGVRTAMHSLGAFLALGGMFLLIKSDSKRDVAGLLVIGVSVAMLVTTVLAVRSVREPPEHRGRGGRNLMKSIGDVSRNPHASRLFTLFFIENFGTGSLMLLIPFVFDYVFQVENLAPAFMFLYFVSALLFIPAWIWLSRRVGKKKLWLFSMATMAVGFCGLFFIDEHTLWLCYVVAFVVGLGGGCANVVGPSVQADVIDVDEYLTGDRKEGAYFAVWNFVRKSGVGIATMLTGLVLGWVGFEAGHDQSDQTLLAMRVLFSFAPGLCYAVGTVLFIGFELDEAKHAEVRAALDGRRLTRSSDDAASARTLDAARNRDLARDHDA
jgi:GPH family glycoside/pentoside/hexuronide:cation symporter